MFLAGRRRRKPRFSLGSKGTPRPSLGASRRVWLFWPRELSNLGARHNMLGRVATHLPFGLGIFSLTWGKSRLAEPSRDPPGRFGLGRILSIIKARGFEPRVLGQFLLPGLVEIEVLEASFVP